MRRCLGDPFVRFIITASGSDVDFATDDGLDSVTQRLLVKFDRPKHGTVIGDGQGGHGIFAGFLEKLIQADRSVQKAELGMQMEMDKVCLFHGLTFQLGARSVDRGETAKTKANNIFLSAPSSVQPALPSRLNYSHSMVLGGLDEMSYTTRLTPLTSLIIRLDRVASISAGKGTQSAVIPSWL